MTARRRQSDSADPWQRELTKGKTWSNFYTCPSARRVEFQIRPARSWFQSGVWVARCPRAPFWRLQGSQSQLFNGIRTKTWVPLLLPI